MAINYNFYRIAKLLLFTAVTSTVAYTLALELRFEFDFSNQMPQFSVWFGLVLLIGARIIAYPLLHAADVVWRYFSLVEFISVVRAHSASSVLFAAEILVFRVPGFPRSIIMIEFMISMLLNSGLALLVRVLFERNFYPFGLKRDNLVRDCLVLGGGDSGHLLVKTLLTQKSFGYRPIGVLDDAERTRFSSVHQVPVLGKLSQLEENLSRFPAVDIVFIAIPTLPTVRLNEIRGICDRRKVEVRRLQSFEDIAVKRTTQENPAVPIEIILNREITFKPEPEVIDTFSAKTIMVTGGSGSIGSEVIRQLIPLQPERIIIVDNSEYFLFRFEQELKNQFSDIPLNFVLADVTDNQRINYIILKESPNIIVHTAAYKHVPLNELNPYSAFVTNVIGTGNVVNAAISSRSERIILLSTDKAVDPVNVMGCTKRLAEMLTQGLIRSAENSITRAAIVRFGNVINSRGSVIPLFREQIFGGGPLTVTDPKIERFFMSTQEAVRLMLAAGSLGNSAEIFALDMGEKIRIIDVAKKMLSLYGREDIPIVFTGLRPGERLTEDVASLGDEVQETIFDKVWKIVEEPLTHTTLLNELNLLSDELVNIESKELTNRIFSLVSVPN